MKGVTPPISTTMPSSAELAANEELIEELKRENNFEAPEETEKRCDATLNPEMIVS